MLPILMPPSLSIVLSLLNKAISFCECHLILLARPPFLTFVFPRFTQADVREFAGELINVLLTKIESAGTPEKVAENDHLMKCW